MQSQWPTVVIKPTFKSCTDREDTGPWRGLHCAYKDEKTQKISPCKAGQGRKTCISSFSPYTHYISPIDI